MKKVRGYLRYLNGIQESILKDSELDVDYLKEQKYFNFQFEDWYGYNIGIKGKGRKFVLENLIRIYKEWKIKLEELNCEFYLAIWLFDPFIEQSEIVCAIDSKIEYYENEAFLNSNQSEKFISENFKPFNEMLVEFTWIRKVNIEPTYEWEMEWLRERYEFDHEYFTDQRFYKKLKEKPYHVAENDDGKIYFRKIGDVWIGKKY